MEIPAKIKTAQYDWSALPDWLLHFVRAFEFFSCRSENERDPFYPYKFLLVEKHFQFLNSRDSPNTFIAEMTSNSLSQSREKTVEYWKVHLNQTICCFIQDL
jgi:hypothetical protein